VEKRGKGEELSEVEESVVAQEVSTEEPNDEVAESETDKRSTVDTETRSEVEKVWSAAGKAGTADVPARLQRFSCTNIILNTQALAQAPVKALLTSGRNPSSAPVPAPGDRQL
jgi:hypothetical protein